ncbi:MAG TPA: hypothetical protein VER11_12895 [Polyangiaceae bacterium]|nr:hypothetical protein [Polyangiaceae bacterium]
MRSIEWRCTVVWLLASACRPSPAAAPRASSHAPVVQVLPEAQTDSVVPNRLGIGGNTRGTVACGSARCNAPREVCALMESGSVLTWQCVPSEREVDTEQRYACDDESDCGDGQTCCLGFESAFVHYACSARSGASANCALESCVPGGAPCPALQLCKAGSCAPSDARATCNQGQRCPASTPICQWAQGIATCVSEPTHGDQDELSSSRLLLSCTSSRDCGVGLQCCSNAIGSESSCRVGCDLANNQQLCERDADCASGGAQKFVCLPAEQQNPGHFPPWVRVCGTP